MRARATGCEEGATDVPVKAEKLDVTDRRQRLVQDLQGGAVLPDVGLTGVEQSTVGEANGKGYHRAEDSPGDECCDWLRDEGDAE